MPEIFSIGRGTNLSLVETQFWTLRSARSAENPILITQKIAQDFRYNFNMNIFVVKSCSFIKKNFGECPIYYLQFTMSPFSKLYTPGEWASQIGRRCARPARWFLEGVFSLFKNCISIHVVQGAVFDLKIGRRPQMYQNLYVAKTSRKQFLRGGPKWELI